MTHLYFATYMYIFFSIHLTCIYKYSQTPFSFSHRLIIIIFRWCSTVRQVFLKPAFGNELSFAPITREPLPSMVPHVILKVLCVGESTAAHGALVGVDASVNVDMSLECRRAVQLLPTDSTLESTVNTGSNCSTFHLGPLQHSALKPNNNDVKNYMC